MSYMLGIMNVKNWRLLKMKYKNKIVKWLNEETNHFNYYTEELLDAGFLIEERIFSVENKDVMVVELLREEKDDAYHHVLHWGEPLNPILSLQMAEFVCDAFESAPNRDVFISTIRAVSLQFASASMQDDELNRKTIINRVKYAIEDAREAM